MIEIDRVTKLYGERRVVEQKQAQRHGEQIEECVITCEKNKCLKKQNASAAEEPPTPRHKNQERNRQLDEEHRGR